MAIRYKDFLKPIGIALGICTAMTVLENSTKSSQPPKVQRAHLLEESQPIEVILDSSFQEQSLDNRTNSLVQEARPTRTAEGYRIHPGYWSIEELADKREREFGIKNDLMNAFTLTECTGNPNAPFRFEPEFRKRYFDKGKALEKNPKYLRVYRKLQKQNPDLTLNEFINQLCTSVGAWQVMYCYAIERGFQGSIKELAEPEANSYYAALKIQEQSSQTHFDPILAGIAYNTGTINGKPAKGYLKRLKSYISWLNSR